jgi:hypothetical protein
MVKVIVGMMGSSVGGGSSSMATPGQVQEFLDCIKRHGIKELDTARVMLEESLRSYSGRLAPTRSSLYPRKRRLFRPTA